MRHNPDIYVAAKQKVNMIEIKISQTPIDQPPPFVGRVPYPPGIISVVIENSTPELKTVPLFNLAHWYKHGSEFDGIKISLRQSFYDLFFLQNSHKYVTFKGLKMMALQEEQLKQTKHLCSNDFVGTHCSQIYTPYANLVNPLDDQRNVKTALDDDGFEWEWSNDKHIDIDVLPGEKYTLVFCIASIETPCIDTVIIEKAKKYDLITNIVENKGQ